MSEPGEGLAAGLPFWDDAAPIRIVPGMAGAMVTGIRRPIVWIGRRHVGQPSFQTLCYHEWVHIRRHDNSFLLWLQFTNRLFWWNPLVYFFTSRAKAYMELSCDSDCAAQFKRELYLSHLIEATLAQQDAKRFAHPIHAGALRSKNFNLHRITALDRTFRWRWHHGLTMAMACLALGFTFTRPEAQAGGAASHYIDLTGHLLTMAPDNIGPDFYVAWGVMGQNGTCDESFSLSGRLDQTSHRISGTFYGTIDEYSSDHLPDWLQGFDAFNQDHRVYLVHFVDGRIVNSVALSNAAMMTHFEGTIVWHGIQSMQATLDFIASFNAPRQRHLYHLLARSSDHEDARTMLIEAFETESDPEIRNELRFWREHCGPE